MLKRRLARTFPNGEWVLLIALVAQIAIFSGIAALDASQKEN